MFSRQILPFVIMCSQFFASCLFAQQFNSNRSYFLKDYQYFKPMVANLRTSQNHARVYVGDAVAFSNSTKSGKHLFFDNGFGGYFPFLGWKSGARNDSLFIPLRNRGFAFFVDGAAHLLLDLNTQSSDVMNTDYRIGVGVVSRFLRNLAVRAMFFHESTHLGDEYTLDASLNPNFRRYNVSYEAVEVNLALDHYDAKKHSPAFGLLDLFRKPDISYSRLYGGIRYLNKVEYSGVTGLFVESQPIKASHWEFQMGGEVYFRAWQPPNERKATGSGFIQFWKRFLQFQQVVLAVETSPRVRYGIPESSRQWSANIVLGFVYGKNFGVTRNQTVRWQLNYYNGVNPHGQFRNEKTSYFGFDYIIDFAF